MKNNKRKKYKRLNKRGKKALLVILIVLSCLLIRKVFINKNKDVFKYVEQSKKYDIKIDYNKTNIKEIDDKVKKYIVEKKNSFVKEAKKNNFKNNIKFDLIIDFQNILYNEVYYIHGIGYEFLGGNHYVRSDVSYNFDKRINKFIKFNDILNNKDEFKKLAILAKKEVYNYFGNSDNVLDTDSIVDDEFYKKKNYNYFYLNEKGLTIIFPPYRVSSGEAGEIKITLGWDKIYKFIKEEYKTDIDKNIVNEITERKVRDLTPYKNKKLIAFTFDDGPNNKTTSLLLDNLDEYDAKVTFFMLGSRISYNEDVVKRAYLEGNDIGSHSYSHRNLLQLSDKEVLQEISKTNKVIEDITKDNVILFRPPYGSINSHIKKISNMHIILWNVDSLDWKLKNREKIKNEIITNARDGAIVLVHDIYEESVMGALLAMAELEKEGYAFVTISEMLELKEKTLNYETSYYNFS